MMHTDKAILITLLALLVCLPEGRAQQKPVFDNGRENSIWLDSRAEHNGAFSWKMMRASDVSAPGEKLSLAGYDAASWQDAVVPGTVLTSLVYNKVYPDPYFGDNNKLSQHKIPDISEAGRDFYTYWYRTEFSLPASFRGKTVWLQLDGIIILMGQEKILV